MLVLLILVIFGLAAAEFATQNTQTTSLIFANYTVRDVPMYAVALGGLLLGIFLSWIISLVDSVFSFFSIHGKDANLKESKKEVIELTKRVHKLEIENARLKTELHEPIDVDDKSL